MKVLGITGLLGFLLSQVAIANSPKRSVPDLNIPNARDLYVGCYLLVKGEEIAQNKSIGTSKAFSADRCMMQSALTISMFRNKPDGFCPSASLEFDADPIRSMALTYLVFYESLPPSARGLGGDGALLFSAKQKWPCN